jgi:membrane protease YdiL (CAAX protease family)
MTKIPKQPGLIHILYAILILYFSQIVGGIVSLLIVGLIRFHTFSQFLKKLGPLKFNVHYLEKLTSKMMYLPEIQIIGFLLSIFTIIFLLVFWKKVLKRDETEIGLVEKLPNFNYLKAVGIGALLIIFIVMVNYHSLQFKVKANFEWINIWWLIATALGFAIQGLSEELLFRGYLFKMITEKYNILIGALISSAVFALIHADNEAINIVAILNLFCFGFLMAVIYEKTKNIWFVTAIHSTWNFFIAIVFGGILSGRPYAFSIFKMRAFKSGTGIPLLNGGNFGIEGGLIVTLTLVICISFCLRKTKFIQNRNQTHI